MEFPYIYNLSPEGVAGAAGSDKSVEGDKAPEDKEDNSGGEGSKTEDSSDQKVKVVVDGRVVHLDPAVAHDMLQRGIKQYIAEQQDQGQNKPKTGDEEDTEEDKTSKAITDLTATVNALKDSYLKDKVAAERREIQRTLSSLSKSHDLTKDDPEISKMIEGLVIGELQANPNADIEEVYKKKVGVISKKFQLKNKEYKEEKIKDAKNTKGPSSTGGSSPGGKEPEKPKSSDLQRGNIRRQAMARLSAEAAAKSGGRFS